MRLNNHVNSISSEGNSYKQDVGGLSIVFLLIQYTNEENVLQFDHFWERGSTMGSEGPGIRAGGKATSAVEENQDR